MCSRTMSKNFWLESKASIILLPSGAQGEELFQLASSWAEVGLIGPALWIKPEEITLVDGEPPKIMAEIIGVGPERELVSVKVDLFEQLAREALRLIRFVKVRSATSSREFDSVQDKAVDLIEDYMSWAMPAPDKKLSDRDERQAFEVVNLICSPTEFRIKDRANWLRPGRGMTILAAPEDRTNPWATDAFVRDNKKFSGFTLMHLASAAGIWNGLPIGTLELFEKEKSTREGVWISRTFFSGVLTDGLARRVAAGVLIEAANGDFELPVAPVGTAFIEDSNHDSYVSSMVDASFTLDSGILEYSSPPPLGLLDKAKIGIGAQLASYFKFTGKKAQQMPYWTWMWIKRRVARKVQQEFQGDEGRYEVGLGLEEPLDAQDNLLLSRFGTVRQAEERAKLAMQTPVRLSDLRSTPSLWAGLRELVFGSLDGGFDLSTRGFPLLEGDVRPIFRKVSNLFQDLDDKWEAETADLPDGVPSVIGWDELSQANDVSTLLRNWVSSANTELDGVAAGVVFMTEQINSNEEAKKLLRDQLIELGAIVVNAAGEDELMTLAQAAILQKEVIAAAKLNAEESSDEADPEVEVEGPEIEEVTIDIPNMIREYKALLASSKKLHEEINLKESESQAIVDSMPHRESVLNSFEDWRRSNERSFLWRMHSAMNVRLDKVRTDLSAYQERLANIKLPEPMQLLKLRKKFHKSVLISFGIISFISYLAISIPENNPSLKKDVFGPGNDYPEPWVIIIYALTIFLALFFTFASAYHRGWSKFERAVDLILQDLNHVADGNRICRSEEQRLTLLYRQTVEWLELIAKTLSNPWSVKPAWLESGLKKLDLDALPFAMRVAQADEGDVSALESLRLSAIKKMAQPGWRYKSFERLVEQVAVVAGNVRGLSVEMLDRDLPHASNNSRSAMKAHFLDAPIQERVAVSFLKPLIQDLQGQAMTDARPRVIQVENDPIETLRSDIEGIAIVSKEQPWTEFLTHTLSLGDGLPDPVTPLSVMSITPTEIQAGIHERVSSYAVMPERVARTLSESSMRSLNVRTYSDKTSLPLDSVLRVDLAGPLAMDSARLWSESTVVSAPTSSSLGGQHVEQRSIRRGIVD